MSPRRSERRGSRNTQPGTTRDSINEFFASYANFDYDPTSPIWDVFDRMCDVENKTTRFRFHVQDVMCNEDGHLHSGAASTIFDNLSSTALFTVGRRGFWDNLGVSRLLSVVFHRPLPLNTPVVLLCWVVSAGKRLTHLRQS